MKIRGFGYWHDLRGDMTTRRGTIERFVKASSTSVRVRSRVRGREITIGRGGDYTWTEVALLAGAPRKAVEKLDLVKRAFPGSRIEG